MISSVLQTPLLCVLSGCTAFGFLQRRGFRGRFDYAEEFIGKQKR